MRRLAGPLALVKPLVLVNIGGTLYITIELLYRGRTHWTMYALGGLCFYLVGLVNEIIPWGMPLVWQSAIGGCIITALELLTGCIVNLWLGWDVWDYSGMPLNLWGQICLPFYFAWVLLGAVAIIMDDCLRYWLFREERPRYKLFTRRGRWIPAYGH